MRAIYSKKIREFGVMGPYYLTFEQPPEAWYYHDEFGIVICVEIVRGENRFLVRAVIPKKRRKRNKEIK